MKCKPDPTKQYRSGENNFFVMSVFCLSATERNGTERKREANSSAPYWILIVIGDYDY